MKDAKPLKELSNRSHCGHRANASTKGMS